MFKNWWVTPLPLIVTFNFSPDSYFCAIYLMFKCCIWARITTSIKTFGWCKVEMSLKFSSSLKSQSLVISCRQKNVFWSHENMSRCRPPVLLSVPEIDNFPMIPALAAGSKWAPSLDPKPQTTKFTALVHRRSTCVRNSIQKFKMHIFDTKNLFIDIYMMRILRCPDLGFKG